VPFYDSSLFLFASDLAGAQFTLTSSAGDKLMARGAHTQLDTVDLTIDGELRPNTTYTLAANVPVPSSSDLVKTLSFTTGAGPLATPPAPPQGFLQHYQFEQALSSSCSPREQGTCVAVSGGVAIEETNVDEFGQDDQYVYLRSEPWFTDLSGMNQGTNFRCVKLRTRAENGLYSSPLVLCGAEAARLKLHGSEAIACTSRGITQDGTLVASQETQGPSVVANSPSADPSGPSVDANGASCSSTPRGKGSGGSVLGALFALALVARASRRARAAR